MEPTNCVFVGITNAMQCLPEAGEIREWDVQISSADFEAIEEGEEE